MVVAVILFCKSIRGFVIEVPVVELRLAPEGDCLDLADFLSLTDFGINFAAPNGD